MLFSNNESYVIAEIQNRCGFSSRIQTELELQHANVVGVPIGSTIAYHGKALNDMILRTGTTPEDRGQTVKRRTQKRTPGGKFAAKPCPKCSAKMSRGVCPVCG